MVETSVTKVRNSTQASVKQTVISFCPQTNNLSHLHVDCGSCDTSHATSCFLHTSIQRHSLHGLAAPPEQRLAPAAPPRHRSAKENLHLVKESLQMSHTWKWHKVMSLSSARNMLYYASVWHTYRYTHVLADICSCPCLLCNQTQPWCQSL